MPVYSPAPAFLKIFLPAQNMCAALFLHAVSITGEALSACMGRLAVTHASWDLAGSTLSCGLTTRVQSYLRTDEQAINIKSITDEMIF